MREEEGKRRDKKDGFKKRKVERRNGEMEKGKGSTMKSKAVNSLFVHFCTIPEHILKFTVEIHRNKP